MTPFNLLRPMHMMVGVDPHEAIMPPSSKKVPFVPHVVFAALRGGTLTASPGYASTVKHAPTVQVHFEDVLQRATDIGWFIPHEMYNVLMPFLLLNSKSKSHFGAGTVKAQGRPVATAVHQTSTVNLNCGEPVRVMSGFVSAPNTVRAGMTEGDMIAGLAEAIFDTGLSLLKSQFSPWVMKGLSRILGKGFQQLINTNPRMKELVEQAVKTAYKKATDPIKPSDEVWDEVADELNDSKHRVFL